MFHKWGNFSYQHRRIVPLLIIAAILVLYVLFGLRLGERMSQEGWDDPGSSSTAAAAIELETFGRDNNGDVILLFETEAESGQTLNDPVIFESLATHLDQLEATYPDQVDTVTSYFNTRNAQLINDDGTQAFASIGLSGDGEQTLKDFREVKDSLVPENPPEGVTTQVGGATAVADALDEGMAGDIVRAEVVALPVVALLLLVVFGSVVAAFMPLIVGVLSIAGSLGILSVLAGVTQVNVFAQSVVTLLGLGLAIDYGLFMVSRFREELDRGKEVKDAVITTTSTAGKTVVFSAAMVAVALSGLLVFPQAFLKSVAYGAISAVALAALLSVTVLPALFGLLGRNIDKWSIRKTKRTARRLEDTLWFRIPAWSMRHAKLVTVVVAGVLIALTIPLTGVKFGGINETYLPPDNETRIAQDEFNDSFPAFRTEPVKLVVTDATETQLVDIYVQTRDIEGLSSPFSPDSGTEDGTTVLSAGIADRDYNEEVIDQLRALDIPEGVNVYIGGTPAMEIESIEALLEKLPWMALYIVIATFLLMAAVFGSLILPAKAVIMTVLGLGATLGILTAIFVNGVGADLFNFTPGPLMSPVLVLIVAIVYGLSTDYEVFLVSRMVEARDRGESTDDAIKYGTARTGSIITAAALIMIVVAGAFAFSEIVMMKYIAFGMIAALAIDATIIRMMLVPAVMHLLQDDNWWAPPLVRKIYHKLGHSETPAPTSKESDVDKHPDNAELLIDSAVVVDEEEAARSGRSTRDNDELVPFAELMRRLQSDEDNPRQLER